MPNYAMPMNRVTKILFKYFMPRRVHHNVYVIEPSKVVLYGAKFKKCNPNYITGKPCMYVGLIGLLRCAF